VTLPSATTICTWLLFSDIRFSFLTSGRVKPPPPSHSGIFERSIPCSVVTKLWTSVHSADAFRARCAGWVLGPTSPTTTFCKSVGLPDIAVSSTNPHPRAHASHVCVSPCLDPRQSRTHHLCGLKWLWVEGVTCPTMTFWNGACEVAIIAAVKFGALIGKLRLTSLPPNGRSATISGRNGR